ncbi:DUF2927 domain-containing protein [Paracoccaceae bacterium Fryx2]|nr:DUF2927 domain-containing protein [Paracoccaceae bacterium Fryx2]
MRLAIFCVLALTACASAPPAPQVSMGRPHDAVATTALPAMKSFGAPRVASPGRSNAQIARDFLDLEFQMESGRILPVFTRFEGPVTVAIAGQAPPTAAADLARLVQRFRTEAGIDIRQTTGPASITVEFLPRERIQATFANVACFVAPRVSSWAEYRGARGGARTDWTTLTVRERVAIFVPSDTSPQEVRDCLHEETAQALGPLNDLYRLPDSVFNDDNFHTVLTGFDMLVLRLHYAPELRSGMTRAQVAAALPGLLARLNPAGERPGPAADEPTPREWITAVETALGPRSSAEARRRAAAHALAIARAQGWQDARLGFSLFALARMSLGQDATEAAATFAEAARIYRSLPGGQIHAAHADMQLAALALSSGQAGQALALADAAIPAVAEAENAALLATLMLIKAEALDLAGRGAEARAVRLDSLGWARYGFGTDAEVRARMADIAALAPRGSRG